MSNQPAARAGYHHVGGVRDRRPVEDNQVQEALDQLMYGLQEAKAQLYCHVEAFKAASNPVEAVQEHSAKALHAHHLLQELSAVEESLAHLGLDGKYDLIGEMLVRTAQTASYRLEVSSAYMPIHPEPQSACCALARFQAQQSFTRIMRKLAETWERVARGELEEEKLREDARDALRY